MLSKIWLKLTIRVYVTGGIKLAVLTDGTYEPSALSGIGDSRETFETSMQLDVASCMEADCQENVSLHLISQQIVDWPYTDLPEQLGCNK